MLQKKKIVPFFHNEEIFKIHTNSTVYNLAKLPHRNSIQTLKYFTFSQHAGCVSTFRKSRREHTQK